MTHPNQNERGGKPNQGRTDQRDPSTTTQQQRDRATEKDGAKAGGMPGGTAAEEKRPAGKSNDINGPAGGKGERRDQQGHRDQR